MAEEQRRLTLLERLDVALATRVALRRQDVDLGRPEDLRTVPAAVDLGGDARWVQRVLSLRGFEVRDEDAVTLVASDDPPPIGSSQEARLVYGLGSVLRAMRERAAAGRPPDGWHAVALFRRLTGGIARFRANALRRDEPWDGVVGVGYPPVERIPRALEEFCEARSYGEPAGAFQSLHPVRRSVRLLWSFARLAPFPDFNGLMAFVLMNEYLLAKGYPMVTPDPVDRDLLARLVAGPRPRRVVQFESRLVAAVGA